jgi:hypothetical protein
MRCALKSRLSYRGLFILCSTANITNESERPVRVQLCILHKSAAVIKHGERVNLSGSFVSSSDRLSINLVKTRTTRLEDEIQAEDRVRS